MLTNLSVEFLVSLRAIQVDFDDALNHVELRRRVSRTLVSDPWNGRLLADVFTNLTEDKGLGLADVDWTNAIEPAVRSGLYRALCEVIRAKYGIRRWSEVSGKSLSELEVDIVGTEGRGALADMLFDVSRYIATIKPEPDPVAGPNEVAPFEAGGVVASVLGILSGFDERELYVLRQRQFVKEPPTLAVIAEEFEITRERVRQIESKVKRKITSELNADKGAAEAARRFNAEIGPVFPDEDPAVDDVWELILGMKAPNEAKEALAWQAGPFQFKDGYWTNPEIWDPDRIDEELSQCIADGGTDHQSLVGVLTANGVLPQFADDLLAANPKLNRIVDRYIWGRPTWSNRAAAVLQQYGEPMTLDELAAVLEVEADSRSLRNAIALSDEIIKVGTKQFGLPEWGLTEYTSVSDAIATEIEKLGGIADFSEIVKTVSETSGARDQSVRMYCTAPRFVREGHQIRLRRQTEPYSPDTSRLLTRRTIFAYPDRTCLRIEVNSDDLRGSGRSLPDDIVFHLGAQLDERVEFKGDGFELALTRPSSSPETGSLSSPRELLLLLDASPGDELRLDFYTVDKRVHATLIRQDGPYQSMTDLERLKLLTGARSDSSEDLLNELDEALDYPLAGVEATLKVRGDIDAVLLLERIAQQSA